MAPAKKKPTKKAPAKKALVEKASAKAPVDESSWQFYKLSENQQHNLSISFLKKEYPVISNMISSSIENIKSGVFGHAAMTIQVEIAVSFYRRDCIKISFSVAGFEFINLKIMLKDYDEPKKARITVEVNDLYISHLHPIHPSSFEPWYIQSRYAVWRLKEQIEDKMKSVNAAIVAKATKLASSVDSDSDDE
jgi:hypothetical protein